MKDFDCIIVGAGMGGLSAAGRLAARGAKVLLIDKNKTPGGYLQSFNRKGFRFDSSVDCFGGLNKDGPIDLLLKELDVEGVVDPLRVDPVRRSIFPGHTINVWSDIDRYTEELSGLFPAEAGGIKKLFTTMGAIYDDIQAWGDFVTGLADANPIPAEIIKHSALTFGELVGGFINDPKLRAILSDRCPFYGLPPSRVSAVAMTALVMSYFRTGAWRTRGGSQRLADAIVKGIKNKGGVVLMDSGVENIVIEDGLAAAIRTTGGEEYTARTVVSAMDFLKTVRSLSGISSETKSRISAQPKPDVSSSFFIVYAGGEFNIDHLGGASSVGYFPTYDMESNFGPGASFNPESSLGVTIPTIDDDTAAPEGMHALSAHEMVDYDYTDNWKDRKEELTERFLKKVALVVPGIKENSTHIEAATPATLERYTGNTGGAAYGWVQVPKMKATKATAAPKSLIKNLFFSGHWAGTGGGVMATAYSGFKAAGDVEKVL